MKEYDEMTGKGSGDSATGCERNGMSSDISVKGISKAFDGKTVFSNLSLSFKRGTITCIMGPSGCGKTTLLRIMAGIEPPDAGSVDGMDTGKAGRDTIAFVFQEDRLSENFSAISNIRMVTGKRYSDAEIRSRLEEIGLRDFAEKKVSEFSGGMKRRVAIARAICYNADILLMDEPFKGLDDKLKKDVMDYVKRNTVGKTVICVTHDRAEAEYLGAGIISIDM